VPEHREVQGPEQLPLPVHPAERAEQVERVGRAPLRAALLVRLVATIRSRRQAQSAHAPQ
jgi:hypothetical protein